MAFHVFIFLLLVTLLLSLARLGCLEWFPLWPSSPRGVLLLEMVDNSPSQREAVLGLIFSLLTLVKRSMNLQNGASVEETGACFSTK